MKTESVRKALAFIGRKGGRVKSAAKAMTARQNGRKGGRPPSKPPK
jgi:hypothetical protein